MKILGTAAALSGTTQFTTSTAVYVANSSTTAAGTVTLRNADDDADLGTLEVPPSTGVVIHMDAGQGLRGDADLFGTQVDANSGR